MSTELTQKIEELQATIEARNKQLDQLDRDCRNLQERLKDALAALPSGTAPVSKEPALKEKKPAPQSGVTKQVWDIADKITYAKRAKGDHPATKAEVVAEAVAAGIKETTAQSSYSAWCHFFEINPKDPSKPYVHKERKEETVDTPVQNNDTPHACFKAPLPIFAPPPPPPAFLPPPPPPAYG